MIGKKFISNKTREEIIVLSRDENNRNYFLCKFIESGEIKSIQQSHIKNGAFKSNKHNNKLNMLGKIFKNNQGYEAEVIEYIGVNNILIRFIEDGTEKFVTKGNLEKGNFRKDKYISKTDEFLNKNKNIYLRSKDGYEFVLKEKIGVDHIKIQFIDDNSTKCVDISSLLSNNVLRYTNKELYEGKIIENRQGIRAEIIKYTNIYNVSIKFLDTGSVKSFSLSKIKNKTFKESEDKTYVDVIKDDFLGKKFYTKDKLHTYKVIEIISSNKVKIQFEDGTIRMHTPKTIIDNNIKYTYDKNNAIGKEFLNYKNEKAVIIVYNSAKSVDLKFEDGELCTNVTMGAIRKGLFVKNKDNTKNLDNLKRKYIGYVFKSSNGDTAKVIDYIDSSKIYVEFQDGYKCYMPLGNLNSDFSHPLTSNKNVNNLKLKYEGHIFITNSGYKIRILSYESSKKVLVEFVDDGIQKYAKIGNILRGMVEHPNNERTIENYRNKYLNKIFLSNSGEEVRVIEYNHSKDIKIEFDDGTVSTVMLSKLQEGKFTNPKHSPMNKEAMANKMLGFSYKNTYGLTAICTNYENTNTVELMFEDGVKIISTKRNILNGKFSHPFHNTLENKESYIVYKMLDRLGNILYIGRSVQFSIRMYQHFSNHIKEDNKEWYYDVENIQYIECENFVEMCNYESYLINKYKPKGNNRNESLMTDNFEPDECKLVWKSYDMSVFGIYQKNVKNKI